MSQPNPVSEATTRLAVCVALFAIVFGRALAIALPGSRAGLGLVLDANRLLGGFLSQLLAVLLVIIIGRLAAALWLDSRLPVTQRLVVTPAAMLIVMLVIAASFDELMSPRTPEISLLLGLSGTLVAINAVKSCLNPIRLRASGIALLLVAAASTSQIAARLLALQASGAALPRQFVIARWLATAATALDALALLVTVVWLMLLWERGRVATLAIVGLAGTFSQCARWGSHSGAGLMAVLLSRSLAQLRREPGSLLPLWLQDTQEILALFIAAVLIVRPRGVPVEQRLCVAMLLLARSSPDIPLCAGLLVAGALGLLRLSSDSNETSESQTELHRARTEAELRARPRIHFRASADAAKPASGTLK